MSVNHDRLNDSQDRDGLPDKQRFYSIPDWMRLIMVFIDRVGFPILACIFFAYMVIVQNQHFTQVVQQMTLAMQANTQTLSDLKSAVDDHMKYAKPVIDAYQRELDGRKR